MKREAEILLDKEDAALVSKPTRVKEFEEKRSGINLHVDLFELLLIVGNAHLQHSQDLELIVKLYMKMELNSLDTYHTMNHACIFFISFTIDIEFHLVEHFCL